MNSISSETLSRPKWAAYWFAVALLSATVLAGCGGGDGLKAPDHPGTAQELVGSSWLEPETNITYTFVDETKVEVVSPSVTGPVAGTYAIQDGIVELTAGFSTKSGTWDGTTLIIEEKTLTRK